MDPTLASAEVRRQPGVKNYPPILRIYSVRSLVPFRHKASPKLLLLTL
jgi:hypothetical protein